MNFEASTFNPSKEARVKADRQRSVVSLVVYPEGVGNRARFQEFLGFENLLLLESENRKPWRSIDIEIEID